MKINSGSTIFISTVCKKRAFYEFSTKSLAQKVYLSEITAKALTFCDRTDDVTYCADVTLFLHATSG